jgi:hypothetical protein
LSEQPPLHRFSKELLEELLRHSQSYSPEVTERLRWFLYFHFSGSVGATCRHFGIARTTFYRWAQRFDPTSLRSLENSPNLLSHKEPASVTVPQYEESPSLRRSPFPWANVGLVFSLIVNALFLGGLLATTMLRDNRPLRADVTETLGTVGGIPPCDDIKPTARFALPTQMVLPCVLSDPNHASAPSPAPDAHE